MIGAADVEFHTPPGNATFHWAETCSFPFCIPEAGINGALFLVFRPKLGVAMCDVTVFDRVARNWEGLAYVDNQQHLPGPARLSNFALPNGASVKVTDAPREYRIDYVGIDDTEIHFDFHGIMPPQDIHDPEQDPLTRRLREQQDEAAAGDHAFAGHFGMTGRAQGELILRGHRYAIDALSTMHHGWGERGERDNANAVEIQAHFDDDLVIHARCALDPRKPDAIGPLQHGYVLKQGRVRGLVAATGWTDRLGLFAFAQEIAVDDEDGHRYVMTGSAVNWGPWAPCPGMTCSQSLTKWNLDGRIGFGPYQEVVSRAFSTRHRLAD